MKKSNVRIWMTGLFLSMILASFNGLTQESDRFDLLPPNNLEGNVVDDNDVQLTWTAPFFGDPYWLHWDSGENHDVFGFTVQGENWDAAAKWDPSDISDLEDWVITGMRFFVNNEFPTLKAKIWSGPDADEIYSQDISTFEVGAWTEVTFDNPVPIDITAELWAGLNIDMQQGGYVMGMDEGPAVDEYGNLYRLAGGEWYHDFDKNFNIQILVSPPVAPRETDGIIGYNVFRDDVQLNENTVPATAYLDKNLFNGTYAYYVTTVYDEGESDHSDTIEIIVDQPVILESDSLALVDLYNECNGVNWVSQDNWFETPLSEWAGVESEDTRVVGYFNVSDNIEGDIPESFGDLTALEELYISGNPITSLPESFGNLSSLVEFWMAETEINSLPANFGDLGSLVELSISDNPNLTELSESFGNLYSLEWFGMGRCAVTSLPDNFGDLDNMTQCWIDNNQLTELPESFGDLANLQHFGVGNNMLTSLPESFGDLPSLISFAAGENNITQLPENFGNISTLEVLRFYLNGLEALPDNFGDLESLKELYLSINSLTELPASFSNLGSLERCALDQNMLETLPEDFGDLSNLWDLSLSGNNLTKLPESIEDLNSMLVMFVVDNQLNGLPEGIGGMEKIQLLGLGKNNIDTVPETIGNLSALGYLDLSDNVITALPESFGNLEADTMLIFNNHLKELPESMFDNNYDFLWVENNALQFGSLEPFDGQVGDYIYSPQDKFGNDTILYPDAGGNFTYTMEVSGENNEYQWYKDGVSLGGQTSNTLTLNDVTAEDEGVYTLEVTNTLLTDLTLESHGVVVDVIITSMEEFDVNNISVYPNPATGSVVNLNTGISSGKVQVLNTTGQIISEQELNGPKTQINISTLTNGIYFLRTTDGVGNLSVIKFIKN